MPSPAAKFQFGKNWKSYSTTSLTREKIEQAREDLNSLLAGISIGGKSFLDIGFGQGLTLCLAAELGADVLGIDIDPENQEALAATHRFFPNIFAPRILEGSILDDKYVTHLKNSEGFDVVHSWGVLHHTGDLNHAIENACQLVKPGGYLIIAIYTSHFTSPIWKKIKQLYCCLPDLGQATMIACFYPLLYLATWLCTGRSPHSSRRGMSFFHDVVDWVGGYPYEFASPEAVETLVKKNGFRLIRLERAKVPTGNNEYVFIKNYFAGNRLPTLTKYRQQI